MWLKVRDELINLANIQKIQKALKHPNSDEYEVFAVSSEGYSIATYLTPFIDAQIANSLFEAVAKALEDGVTVFDVDEFLEGLKGSRKDSQRAQKEGGE